VAGVNIPVMRTATCSYLPRPLPSSWRMVLCPCFKRNTGVKARQADTEQSFHKRLIPWPLTI